ncbi:NADH:flavin oxidoreductase/NADH oxidase [Cellulomonas sp. PhB143]|uniref:NADH:flavin oxidoreductase/NADH oxidase n=1 Tax=Cellulomonas sp. PhB143 TaxID=2485186 RepID=UPI000F4A8965|nr:NADH:flavin oxidoreductase/NADH oxidase [Cellulomonas sp. PhB143]ROS76571.1 2,4-dienoyl-CoA reductase-like NADH-dependent reductase (Old Yellow Enzyme family) [Cellulomonas sp. PhB143]
MTHLFQPLTLRGLTIPNRIWLAPMCQYSSVDGLPGDWHLVHLGARAGGGFGLILTEAAAVVPEGRISPQDAGIWDDAQRDAWARVVAFVQERGSRIGVQLAHAGRKASTYRPWAQQRGSVAPDDGGWATQGPSPEPYPGFADPQEMSPKEIAAVPRQFADAARRADEAGFDVVEVHAAHGYLLHQFLSPLSNLREDGYGGTLENRSRLLVEVVDAVRAAWPEDKPLLVRLSATEWRDDGLGVDDVAAVSRVLAEHGVDLVDVSSGGNVPAQIPVGPGYQVPAARRVREGAGLPVSAVGLITTAAQAEQTLVTGAADAVMIGREGLRDPMWPLRAAAELGVVPGDGAGARVPVPQPQYARAPF